MDLFVKWISIIGSIASIAGAFWAAHEARKAEKSATKAENVKNEIVDRRKLVEVSQIHTETKRILKTVSKVGPSCNESLIRGVSCSSVAQEVEEFTRFLNEQSSHFTEFFDNKAKDLCESLKSDIESLSEASTFNDKKKYGKSIYYKINDFMPTVKSLTDSKKEQVNTN